MDPNEFKKRCKGIVPVQFCPYTREDELDLGGLKRNTEFLVDFAEKGGRDLVVMTNGSTTEFYANSVEEQQAVIKTVVDTVEGKVPVIAGTAQAGTRETVKMTRYAEEAGVDCAVIVIPYYHTPTREGLYRHYKAIADSTDIGIMVYNNPAVSGALIDPKLMQRLSKIDSVVALKDNTPNAAEYFSKVAQIDPDDMVLLGGLGEVHFVGAAAYGLRYKGFVTSIGNFAPSLSYQVYDATRKGDFVKAQEALERVMPIFSITDKFMKKRETTSIIPSILRTNYMYMSVGKACMDLVGLKGGILRPPMEDLTEEERMELREVLRKLGLLEA